jgi:hypothetical protein
VDDSINEEYSDLNLRKRVECGVLGLLGVEHDFQSDDPGSRGFHM